MNPFRHMCFPTASATPFGSHIGRTTSSVARVARLFTLAFMGLGCGQLGTGQASQASAGGDLQELSAAERSLFQGLTVLGAGPDARATLAYRAGDRVIYLESRRQRTPPEVLARDATTPAFTTDLRVTDRDGSPIYVRLTGDDVDWLSDAPEPRSLAGRARDIVVARQALAAVADSTTVGLPPEFEAQRPVALEVVALFEAMRDGASAPSAAGDALAASELRGAFTVSAAATYMHRVELWSKPCCAPGSRHSAARVANWNGSAWVSTTDFCNHGTCPNVSPMTEDCSYTSGWRSGAARARECTTKYNGTSTVGYHNCNDDSHLEVIDVRHNALHATDQGSCHDILPNPTPDGCDPSVW